MGRKVKVRLSYRNDAMFMMRLTEAVDRDDKQPPEWRQKVKEHLEAITQLFFDAEKSGNKNAA